MTTRADRLAWRSDALAAWSVRAGGWLAAWVAAERGRFAPWLSVFMGAGVVTWFALRTEPAWWTGAVLLAIALAAVIVAWPGVVTRGLAFAAFAAALGFGSAGLAILRALPVEPLPSKAVVLTGAIAGIEILPEGRRLTVARAKLSEDAPALQRQVRIKLRKDDATALQPGDVIRIRALLRPPPPPAYPGAWDLQRDAFFSGLAGYGYALGPASVVAHARPAGIAGWWRGVRDRIAHRLIADLPGAQGAIAATVLTGTPTAIPEADRAAFRDSGLAHLLAVAGLHIGIVMGLAMALARLILALSEHASLNWPCKQIAAAAALAAGAAYMALTGMHVPIMRSFAMASLVVLGLMLGRRAISLRGLALAAAALMLIAPQEVVGVSFQMSFSAVLALIAGYEALRPALQWLRGEGGWRRRMLHHLALLALTSLLAGTASLPYGAYHFGHIQLYYVLGNMAAVPLWALWVMPSGMAALALMPFGLERLALVPMGWGESAVLWIGQTVSSWPAATLPVPHMPGWGLAVLSVGLAWLGLWRTRWRLIGVLPIALGLASPALDQGPDLLVSADARLIALRTPQGAYAQAKPGASKFTIAAFEQFWGAGALQPIPATGDAAGGAIACEGGICRLRRGAHSATALLVPNGDTQASCEGIAAVVSAEPAGHACPDSQIPHVDRFSVWRDGAYAIWLNPDAVRILSDRAERGDRPWVPPVPTPRARNRGNLPMATPEPLPADQ